MRDEVRIRILDGRCCCGTSNQQVPLLGENEFLFPTNAGADQERINQWLIFFLESLKTLTEKLGQKYDVFKSKGGYLNDRQRLIKDFITENQPLKVSDLVKQFPNIGLSTLKKDLQYLRGEQVLTMIGKGKGSVYVLNKKE